MISWQKSVPGLGDATLRRFILKASRALGLPGEVHVLITSNSQMRALNRRFRGKDTATDVLSFPAAEGPPGLKSKRNAGSAGDIAVSAEISARNARQLGHSAAGEVKVLVLHGLLHLAGYDHECDHGEMARKEARLRRRLGVPGSLIERSAGVKARTRSASGGRKRGRTA